MNMAGRFLEQAERRGAEPALIEGMGDGAGTVTFAELERRTRAVAFHLRRAGVRRGDAVLIFAPLSSAFYAALGGVLRLGGVVMVLDPSVGRDAIRDCLAKHPARAVISHGLAQAYVLLDPVLRRIRLRVGMGWTLPSFALIRWEKGTLPWEGILETGLGDAPAIITLTSGSTGRARKVARSHALMCAQDDALRRVMKPEPGELDLTTQPLFVLANLAAGRGSVMPAGGIRGCNQGDVGPVVRQMLVLKPASASGAPAFWEGISRHCAERGIRLTSLRHIHVGGGPVFPRLWDAVRRTAPNAEVRAVYGSTEAEPIAALEAEEMEESRDATRNGRGLLVGRVSADIHLRIIGGGDGEIPAGMTPPEFDALRMRCGETGEVVVAGAHVSKNSGTGEGGLENKICVGGETWHRTGDAGFLDERGRLWLVGRCSERLAVVREDRVLYPLMAEAALGCDDGGGNAAVIRVGGENILVGEKAGRSDEWYRERLAWAGIRRVVRVRRLPRDRRHRSKVDYPALRRRVGSLDSAGVRGGQEFMALPSPGQG